MKSIGAIAIVLFTIVAPRAGVAQALGVDWKLYGGDTTGVSLAFTMPIASFGDLRITYEFGSNAFLRKTWKP